MALDGPLRAQQRHSSAARRLGLDTDQVRPKGCACPSPPGGLQGPSGHEEEMMAPPTPAAITVVVASAAAAWCAASGWLCPRTEASAVGATWP
jgi:hypothetical protein